MRDRAGCHDGARGGSTITGLGTARIEEGAYSRPKPQLLRDLLELLNPPYSRAVWKRGDVRRQVS